MLNVQVSLAKHASPDVWMCQDPTKVGDWRRLTTPRLYGSDVIDLFVEMGVVVESIDSSIKYHAVKREFDTAPVHLWIEEQGGELGQLYITTVAQLFWVAEMLPEGFSDAHLLFSKLDELFEQSVEHLTLERKEPEAGWELQPFDFVTDTEKFRKSMEEQSSRDKELIKQGKLF